MTYSDDSKARYFLAFTCYGARIGIQSNDTEIFSALENAFPPHAKTYPRRDVDWLYKLEIAPKTHSRRKPFHILYSNDRQIARSSDLEMLVASFERDVELAVAQKARRRIFVHAGVVGWQGRAILIPAKSYSGKSTLVRELVRAGATYYSDEFAVLDPRGRVHPFARSPALRDEKNFNHKIDLTELGGKIGWRPLPVGTILFTKFRAGARWRPQLLTSGLGALELLANTVTARSGQPIVLQVLTRVAKHATLWKGARGEASAFARELLAKSS